MIVEDCCVSERGVEGASMETYRPMTLEEKLPDIFRYHSPKDDQPQKYEAIRSKALELAIVIVANTPQSADQTAAIRLLREAVMTANAEFRPQRRAGHRLKLMLKLGRLAERMRVTNPQRGRSLLSSTTKVRVLHRPPLSARSVESRSSDLTRRSAQRIRWTRSFRSAGADAMSA